MTEENEPIRRRSRSHQGLRASRRSQRRQQQQEEEDGEIGVEGEQELGGGSDDERPVRVPPRRSRSQNSALRQSRRRSGRSFRSSNTDADAIPDDQSAKSTNTTKLSRTSRLRNRRSANVGTEDQESSSRSSARRGLEGKERRASSGAINVSGEKRPSFGTIAAGTDLGLLENSQRSLTDRSNRSLTDQSSRSFPERADSLASDDKFLQERKSRQDAILGQVLGDSLKTTGDDELVEQEPEKPKSRTRRPSLTRLSDARKRVQERMGKGSSGEPTRKNGSSHARDGVLAAQSDEEGEMALNDEYDARQLEDRQKISLVDRISNVVATPEKSKRKGFGKQSVDVTTSPLVIGGTKSNWDL